jgi:hypothetical protein
MYTKDLVTNTFLVVQELTLLAPMPFLEIPITKN